MTGSIAVKNVKRILRSGRVVLALCVLFFFLWLIWLLYAVGLGNRVYLQAGAPDTWLVLIVAVVLSLLIIWRIPFITRLRSKLIGFVALFMYCIATLWNVPEAWVTFSASETVQSEVRFTIAHPGPMISRANRCPAGLRFYDAWLNRPVEICTRDALVPPGAQTVQLEKRVSARGAIFTHYRFISASGIPQGWWPVNRPDK